MELLQGSAEFIEAEQFKEAIDVYRRVIEKFSGQSHPAIRSQVAQAMNLTQIVLQERGKDERAIQVSRALVKKFARDDEPTIRKTLAESLSQRAGIYEAAGDFESLFSLYEEIDQILGDDNFPSVVVEIVTFLDKHWLHQLNERQRYQEAIAACDQILRHHPEGRQRPIPNSHVLYILFEKGSFFVDIGEYAKAVDVYDELERRCEDQSDRDSRLYLVKSYRNKAGCLRELGLDEAAQSLQMMLLVAAADEDDDEIRHYEQEQLYLSGGDDEDYEDSDDDDEDENDLDFTFKLTD